MASQVKKNKNQVIRKGKAPSALFKTLQNVDIADVSIIQLDAERVPIDTPSLNSGVQLRVERVLIDTPSLNSGEHSGVERVPIGILNVISGEINESLKSTEKCAKGLKLNAFCEQPAKNSCTEVGGRSLMPGENFDAGGRMHACTKYNESSGYFPKLHYESCSKSSTVSISQIAVKNFAGQETLDYVNNDHVPDLPKTPSPEQLPAMATRMAKDKTWGQHSSSSNNGVNRRSLAFRKHHSSGLQKEFSPQFSNNLDDDGEEYEDVHWEYPGERNSMDQQMMAFDIQYPNSKKHSQMHYGGEQILDNIEQDNQSSKAGERLGGQYGEQTGRTPREHPGGPIQKMQGVYMGNIENKHPFERDSGYTPSWHEEGYSGRFQDEQNIKGLSVQSMENVRSVPTSHHERIMGTVCCNHHARTMEPVYCSHHARTMGPVLCSHHARTVGPVYCSHHARTMGQVSCSHHARTMGPVYCNHHARTIGQLPDQKNEGSMQQIHESSMGHMQGDSVGRMHGGLHAGSVEQMHPHAQSDGQGHIGEFQDVHNEQNKMGQSWDYSKATWQGEGQGNACYSEGVSDFPRPPTHITDRESASGPMGQRVNSTWFQKVVQNMKVLVEGEGLIVKDVFPDGNCLFTAVTDQLRVRGNFNFTPSTLRSAAVDFLRENPKQHDGTHLEQFLVNESWDHYLGRMCNDREWGEHIILGAISEVLKCRIIVLGGMSGNSRTVVQPQQMTDEEEKKIQKEKEEAIGSKTVKDESLAGTDKSEVAAAEAQTFQTGTASPTSKIDVKTKGTDARNRKENTSSPSKQNKKKKKKMLQMGEDLYIGLVGETHYVSLRKKDWEEGFNDKLIANIQKRKAKQRKEEDSSPVDVLYLPEDELGVILDDDFTVDRRSDVPVLHLNFLCREVIKFLLRQDLMPALGRALSFMDADTPDWSCEIFGKEEFMLESLPIPTLTTYYTDLFNSNKESDTWKLDFEYFSYILTKDTLLVESEENKLDIDLIMDRSNCSPSILRLRPVNPSLWGNILCCDLSGVSFLKHVRIDTTRLWKTKTKRREREELDLSFRCSWPQEAAEYKGRCRRNAWPTKAILRRIISEGCRVIPSKEQNDDTLWTFSFCAAKKVLISEAVTHDQKNCYKLWRLVIHGCIKDVHREHSELFRSIMFYACEIIKAETWANSPAACVFYMTDRLIIGLQRKFVPDYFIQKINLIYLLTQDEVSCLKEKLQMIRYHFLASVYFVVDNFALLSGDLLYTYDAISEDITKFRKDKDFQRSLSDLILPAVRKEVKTSVERRLPLYAKAEEMILKWYEGALQFNPSLNFSCYFKQFLEQLDITMQWCLAFYVDKRQGTFFAKDIGENQKTIPITDLFGPELVRILGLFNVPETCIQGKEIVYFVDRVIGIFYELYLDDALVVSLCFFLRKNYVADKEVYVFDNDCIPANNEAESLRKYETRSINRILYDMFVTLYTALRREKRHLEFKDFMLQFENICYRLNTESAYQFLQELWEWFGYADKAERAKDKYLSLKSKETDIDDVD